MADPAWTQLGLFVCALLLAVMIVWLLVDHFLRRRNVTVDAPRPEVTRVRLTIDETTWGATRRSDGSWRILSDREGARERWPWDASEDLR